MNKIPIYVIYNILEYTDNFKIRNALPVSIIPKNDYRYDLLEKIHKIRIRTNTYSCVLFDDKILGENFYISYRIDNYNYNGNYNLYFSKLKYKNNICLEYVVYSL
jgi:hypothetical protein